MKKVIMVAITLLALNSCTDAGRAKIGALGDKFQISIVNCDGSITHTWTSTGKVANNSQSDGYFFNDEKTGTLIEVSGNVIIEKLK